MKLVETKIYSQLIMVTDYVLLGLLWVVASLPLITVVPASVATLYVVRQWRSDSTGQLLIHFYQGLKKHFYVNVLISILTISIYFTTNLLLQENSKALIVSGYVVSIIYLMFLISWVDNCRKNEKLTFFILFERSSFDVVLSFGKNLLCSMLIFGFSILIFLFPPFIFVFSGAIWKLLDLILSRKSREANE